MKSEMWSTKWQIYIFSYVLYINERISRQLSLAHQTIFICEISMKCKIRFLRFVHILNEPFKDFSFLYHSNILCTHKSIHNEFICLCDCSCVSLSSFVNLKTASMWIAGRERDLREQDFKILLKRYIMKLKAQPR